jgi:hypothetical protein
LGMHGSLTYEELYVPLIFVWVEKFNNFCNCV